MTVKQQVQTSNQKTFDGKCCHTVRWENLDKNPQKKNSKTQKFLLKKKHSFLSTILDHNPKRRK
jgi:hypothetical protein